MKLPKVSIELTSGDLLGVAFILLAWRPSWVTASAFACAALYALGCRLIAYRQAEDVSALVARVAKAEEEAKRALTIATAQGRAKAQGF